MIFEQHYLDCLSQASYFIGDESSGRAVVVDPRRDVSPYLELAAEHDLTIELAIETHFHADFLSGHLEPAAATGAGIASTSEKSHSRSDTRPATPRIDQHCRLGICRYDTLHDRLITLRDATRVYPGHGADSSCGKNLSSETWSTVGVQRSENYAVQPMSKEVFIAAV